MLGNYDKYLKKLKFKKEVSFYLKSNSDNIAENMKQNVVLIRRTMQNRRLITICVIFLGINFFLLLGILIHLIK